MSTIAISVVFALPDRAARMDLCLAAGATVADALERFGTEAPPGLDLAHVPVGIFGQRVERDHVLADGDRVEIYRPLAAEPRAARRRRARRPAKR
jgi:uncharacterized protein